MTAGKMKLALLTTALLLSTTMELAAQPVTSPTSPPAPIAPAPQNNAATFNVQLRRAVCDQDWKRAIKVVDQMIAFVSKPPGNSYMYKSELVTYRGKLQRLRDSEAQIPLEMLPSCISSSVAPPSSNAS